MAYILIIVGNRFVGIKIIYVLVFSILYIIYNIYTIM